MVQILNAALASTACSRPQPKRRSEIVPGGPVNSNDTTDDHGDALHHWAPVCIR
jgi:hypothetical protein